MFRILILLLIVAAALAVVVPRLMSGSATPSAGSEAPSSLKKIQLKENIASYCQPRWHGSAYWPVIALLSPIQKSTGKDRYG